MEVKNEENNGKQETPNPVQTLTELECEIKLLNEEKLNLQNIEEKLLYQIDEEIENRKRQKEELKKEIEELKTRCDMLTKILNSFVKQELKA